LKFFTKTIIPLIPYHSLKTKQEQLLIDVNMLALFSNVYF